MTVTTWKRLHDETLDWADPANDEWVASFARRQDTVPAQPGDDGGAVWPNVGGQDDATANPVGDRRWPKLRCGPESAAGQPTARSIIDGNLMRYTRSPDNLWRWDRPDGTGLSADEMQAELANIRWQVENGSWQALIRYRCISPPAISPKAIHRSGWPFSTYPASRRPSAGARTGGTDRGALHSRRQPDPAG
jgi:hypothetical protein